MEIPMHNHLHISSFALMVIAAFIAFTLWLVYKLVVALTRPAETKIVYRDGFTGIPPTPGATRSNPQYQSGPVGGPWATPVQPAPYMQPMYPPGYNNGNGLVEGMILGEMLAGNREGVIVERDHSPSVPPSYDDVPSHDDSGISYDSGSSSDSSSSSDSGGVDISW
jgi:hypothetical protein